MNTAEVAREYSSISSQKALELITSKTGKGVFASADVKYKGAVFGRDSLEVAEDLILINPEITKNILTTLASLQGTNSGEDNEEQYGKIHHEFRSNDIDHEPLDDITKSIFDDLASRWGGDRLNVIYYGSVDSTPLFIRVLCKYCDLYGEEFLGTEIINKDGHKSTMGRSLRAAVEFLVNQLHNSPSGLLSYKSSNPQGLENQAWKDSREFYVHEDGSEVNHEQPVASIEVQGLAYDALILSSKYLLTKRKQLINLAHNTRQLTIKFLWLDDRKYFALGLDQNESGSSRVIKTKTANPAELLDTMLFDDLTIEEQKLYIGAIIGNIFSNDFLTDAGLRSRALSEASLVAHWDYHGSYTTWPKETYDILRGLKRFSFNTLAEQLENRLLNAVKKSGCYPEFLYVDRSGRVLFPAPPEYKDIHEDLMIITSTNKPESVQAWTTSAVLSIKHDKSHPKTTKASSWQKELQKKLLISLPMINEIKSRVELRRRYPDYYYKLQAP